MASRYSFTEGFILGFVTSLLASCGGGGGSGSGGGGGGLQLPISVSVAIAQGSVLAGGTASVTATVSHDAAGRGVTWTVACPEEPCGSISPTTTASGVATIYTAPAAAPAEDKAVTIQATSVSDTTRSAHVTVVFGSLRVLVDPAEAQVDAGSSQLVEASVENDSTSSGVTWAISPASGSGELIDPTSTSVTYVAPAETPATDVQVTITASSVADTAKSATSTITIPAATLVIDPTSATLDAGGTETFAASLQHQVNPVDLNVTWKIEPESGAGTLSGATSTTVTYHAPPTPPVRDLVATITATSITPAGLSAASPVTISAIAVAIDPQSALVPIGAQLSFAATAEHDLQNLGVSWQLVQSGQACAPACGTIASSAAGTAVYQAPAAMPDPAYLALAARSVADDSKSGEAKIVLSKGVLSLAPTRLEFVRAKYYYGRQTLSTTLTNTGNASVTISRIDIQGPMEQSFGQTNDCGAVLPAHAVCDINVTFRPAIPAPGKYTATLLIYDSDVGSPQRVTLSGSVIGPTASLTAVASQFESLRVPAPSGAMTVGTRVLELTDSARKDPFLDDGAGRELALRIWYPAASAAGCRTAPYASPAVWDYVGRLVGVRLPQVTTNSCLNAPIEEGLYPIVVFSHGLTGTLTDYTFLLEDLASRGYAVASVGHTRESTAVELAGGKVVTSLYGSHLTRLARLDDFSARKLDLARQGDIRFVVDELQRLASEPDSPFEGHLDTTAIAVAGHSLGGLTALRALQFDSRVRAAIALEGVMPDATFAVTDRPVLLLDAGRTQWGPGERGLWQSLRGPRLAINLPGATHLVPSDAVWFARGAVKTGELSPELAVSALRDYVAAFLDVHLRGRTPSALIQSRSRAYPMVEVTLGQEEP